MDTANTASEDIRVEAPNKNVNIPVLNANASTIYHLPSNLIDTQHFPQSVVQFILIRPSVTLSHQPFSRRAHTRKPKSSPASSEFDKTLQSRSEMLTQWNHLVASALTSCLSTQALKKSIGRRSAGTLNEFFRLYQAPRPRIWLTVARSLFRECPARQQKCSRRPV